MLQPKRLMKMQMQILVAGKNIPRFYFIGKNIDFEKELS